MIRVDDFVKALSLTTLCASSKNEWPIESADLNRPGLQFAGHYEYFAMERPQVIGKAEMGYLESLEPEVRVARLRKFFSYPIPCVILCRGMRPPEELVPLAKEHDVPVFQTDVVTTRFFMNAIIYMRQCLAPRETLHGVLLEVYGVGVLITGRSGVGKSEAALELVKRGHQLVADDAVEIRRVSNRLHGVAPELIRHYIEVRGVGIIDVQQLFGMGAVQFETEIDLVIQLEQWQDGKFYDRLGLGGDYYTLLDIDLPIVTIPVRPGRNLAGIVEIATMKNRQMKYGYNAARDFVTQFDSKVDAMLHGNGAS